MLSLLEGLDMDMDMDYCVHSSTVGPQKIRWKIRKKKAKNKKKRNNFLNINLVDPVWGNCSRDDSFLEIRGFKCVLTVFPGEGAEALYETANKEKETGFASLLQKKNRLLKLFFFAKKPFESNKYVYVKFCRGV